MPFAEALPLLDPYRRRLEAMVQAHAIALPLLDYLLQCQRDRVFISPPELLRLTDLATTAFRLGDEVGFGKVEADLMAGVPPLPIQEPPPVKRKRGRPRKQAG